MNGLNENYPAETKASAKQPIKRDTSESCRERASDDLDKAGADMTVNERLILERSAANWNARANLLDRVEKTARERGADAQGDGEDEDPAD
jgi:hypothetical protein